MNKKSTLNNVAETLDQMIEKMEGSKPKRTFITILKKGVFQSYHSSFKKACEVMGWDHHEITKGGNARIPDSHDGYVIAKEEKEVTIPCQILRECLASPSASQSHNWGPDSIDSDGEDRVTGSTEVEFTLEALGYTYQLHTNIDYDFRWSEGAGPGDWVCDTDHKVTSVYMVTDGDGEEIHLDDLTERLILLKLSL